ncbi:hypothetical protein BA059_16990 [Mycolicibacterium sp. (ex Dasyatis americana)]|nr:hypothetical protein BA059_16990 [Mycolicibacterium sp. (ex Dasyatis americana)]
MYVRIVTFRLAGLPAGDYQAHASKIAADFSRWPGLHSKIWLADTNTDTYGGIYLFADRDAADASRDTEIFQAMTANPQFANLHLAEFDVIAQPTAISGGPVAPGVVVAGVVQRGIEVTTSARMES